MSLYFQSDLHHVQLHSMFSQLTYLSFICSVIIAGDGRYYNTEAMQIICRVLAANGVSNIWVPKGGIMSTPAVSAAIRTREGGQAQGGIVLTASHNPGGPGEDFGIKYNEGFGQPAGEEFTDAVSINQGFLWRTTSFLSVPSHFSAPATAAT